MSLNALRNRERLDLTVEYYVTRVVYLHSPLRLQCRLEFLIISPGCLNCPEYIALFQDPSCTPGLKMKSITVSAVEAFSFLLTYGTFPHGHSQTCVS